MKDKSRRTMQFINKKLLKLLNIGSAAVILWVTQGKASYE